MKKVTERANDLTYTGAMGFKGEMNKPKGRFFWFLISKGWQKTRPKINQKNRPFGLQARHLQGLHVIVRLLGTEEGVLYWKLLLRIVI